MSTNRKKKSPQQFSTIFFLIFSTTSFNLLDEGVGKEAINEVFRTSFHFSKIKFFGLIDQFPHLTSDTPSLYSLEKGLKLRKLRQVFLDTGTPWRQILIVCRITITRILIWYIIDQFRRLFVLPNFAWKNKPKPNKKFLPIFKKRNGTLGLEKKTIEKTGLKPKTFIFMSRHCNNRSLAYIYSLSHIPKKNKKTGLKLMTLCFEGRLKLPNQQNQRSKTTWWSKTF